jgi:hypothetical protein
VRDFFASWTRHRVICHWWWARSILTTWDRLIIKQMILSCALTENLTSVLRLVPETEKNTGVRQAGKNDDSIIGMA